MNSLAIPTGRTPGSTATLASQNAYLDRPEETYIISKGDKKFNRKNLTKFDIMKTPFLFFQDHKDDYYTMGQEALRGVQEESILSRIFFDPLNVKIIHKLIRKKVFEASNGKYLIEDQDEADLMVVMRSMFLQMAKHFPFDIKDQIAELNDIVSDEVVPGIISEIRAYEGYLEKVFKPREIMDHPQNVSVGGLRILPSLTSIYE